jgi:hypothetical protein
MMLCMLLIALYSACSAAPQPSRERQPPPRVQLVAELIAAPPTPGSLTTVGYLYLDDDGARLVSGLTNSAGTLQPLDALATQIWLGTIPDRIAGELQSNGVVRYGAVRVVGTLAGPGTFGPDGRHTHQLLDVTYTLLVASDISIALLETNLATYEQQVVRLPGQLLLGTSSALLVDQLDVGGVPATNARQLKLAQPIRDQALLSQLQGAPGAAARFGPVTVEGFWQRGVLYPLLITPS